MLNGYSCLLHHRRWRIGSTFVEPLPTTTGWIELKGQLESVDWPFILTLVNPKTEGRQEITYGFSPRTVSLRAAVDLRRLLFAEFHPAAVCGMWWF
mgnify:CR=1 FL=1